MSRRWKQIVAIALVVLLGGTMFGLSAYVMRGFEVCTVIDRLTHTLPGPVRPDNCAPDETLLTRDALQLFGLMFLLVPVGLLGLSIWRQNQRDKEVLERELEQTDSVSADDP